MWAWLLAAFGVLVLIGALTDPSDDETVTVAESLPAPELSTTLSSAPTIMTAPVITTTSEPTTTAAPTTTARADDNRGTHDNSARTAADTSPAAAARLEQ